MTASTSRDPNYITTPKSQLLLVNPIPANDKAQPLQTCFNTWAMKQQPRHTTDTPRMHLAERRSSPKPHDHLITGNT